MTSEHPALPSEPESLYLQADWPVQVTIIAIDARAGQEILSCVHSDLRRIHTKKSADEFTAAFERGLHGPWLFDSFREASERIVVVPHAAIPEDLWFVGDLHGDLLALEMALHHIKEATPAPATRNIVFLGDLVDDGEHGFQVFSRVIREALRHPGTIALIAGNHDEALSLGQGGYSSGVSPAEFSDWINHHASGRGVGPGAELFRSVFAQAPRAVFLDDGLFVAHGGFPHTDLHASILTKQDLERPECLQDFVWTRASQRAPRKLPNRSSRGCQFGYLDLADFCTLAQHVLDRPVNCLIRGHDHAEDRFDLHPAYLPNRLITLNTLSHRLGREAGGPYARTPCIARRRKGRVLEIHRLELDSDFLSDIYPEPKGL